METNIADTLRQEVNKEAYDKNIKIISCLKELKSIIDENSDEPLEINMEDKYMTEIIIKNTIEYIQESVPENNYYYLICLRLFRLLFLPYENLNYDDLDEKINDYQLFLKYLKNQLDAEEKEKYINKEIKIINIEGWRRLLRANYVKYRDFDLIIVMALKFSKSVVEISDLLILILKNKYETNFEVKFDLIKLKDIPEINIAQNFNEIFKNSIEYFYLDFENDKIVKKLLSPEETSMAINQIENEHSESEPKKKKKKHKKKSKKKNENEKEGKLSQNITEESQNEQDAKNTTTSPKDEKLDDESGKKQNESGEKEEAKENIEKRNQENLSSENNIEFEEISQQSKLTNNKDENENSLKEIMNNFQKEIQEQKNQLNQKIETLKHKIENQAQLIKSQNQENAEQKNINNQFKEKIKKLNKDMLTVKNELNKVQFDLNLIKSRGAIKTFIDYFYRGFNLKGAILYEEKFTQIAQELNKYNNIHTDDIVTVNKIRILLRESVVKLKDSNLNAHTFDKSKPLLYQLLKLIEPNNSYESVIKKLESIKADELMLESIKNKEIYYQDFNYNILKQKEQIVYNSIDRDKFLLMLKN